MLEFDWSLEPLKKPMLEKHLDLQRVGNMASNNIYIGSTTAAAEQ